MTPATPETRHRCASDPLASRVAQACAQEFGVTVEQIYGRGRWEPLSEARQVAMYLLILDFMETTTRAGMVFGRDHGTAIHARDKILFGLECNMGNMRERLARIRWSLKPTWWVI